LSLHRDFRGINDVNEPQGDRLKFGANVTGGSAGTKIQGIFTSAESPSKNFTSQIRNCNPLETNPLFCFTSVPLNNDRRHGTWQAKFTNSQGSTTVTLPSVAAIPQARVPFPTSVNISTDGQGNPTIKWTVPSGTVVNDFKIIVYDKSRQTLSGTAQVIEVATLSPTATSYAPTAKGIRTLHR
jgi:hypothetical protein